MYDWYTAMVHGNNLYTKLYNPIRITVHHITTCTDMTEIALYRK